MTQFGRPASDISVGSWSPFPASPTTLYDKINEETPNGDTDYIYSSNDEDECEIALSAVVDPGVGTGHIIRCYAKCPLGSGAKEQMWVALVENGAIRGQSPVVDVDRNSYALIEYTLSEAEANAIGNYANLRLRWHITKVNGGEPIQVTQADFRCPDATEEHSGSSSISGNGSLTGVAKKGGKQSSLISAAGALVAVGLVAMLGFALVSSGGTVAAVGLKATQADAVISGGGAIATTGTKAEGEPHSGSAAISGNGVVVAQGIKGAEDAGAISGGGEVAASGKKGGEGIAEVTGNGSIIAVGTKQEPESYSGSALISGNGSLIISSVKGGEGVSHISQEGAPVSVGEKQASGDSIVTGDGAVLAEGGKGAEESSTISGNGSISTAGEKWLGEAHYGDVIISGGGELTTEATKIQMATGSQASREERELLLIGAKEPVFIGKKEPTLISKK